MTDMPDFPNASEPGDDTAFDLRARAELALAFEFDGARREKIVDGKAGDMRFVRIDGMVWSWKSTYQWADDPEEKIRERALKARLVADVAAH